MSETIKELVYHGCFKHGNRGQPHFDPLCNDCGIAARAAMVELMLQQERRITELEKNWEERLNGNFDTEYNSYSVRGEIATLVDNITPRIDPASVIQSGSDATSATGDRRIREWEDPVGRSRRRQIFDGIGILHEEGGDQ